MDYFYRKIITLFLSSLCHCMPLIIHALWFQSGSYHSNQDYRTSYSTPEHFVSFYGWTVLVGLGRLLIADVSKATHSVGFLRTSDRLAAGTSTWQHTTLTRNRHQCPRQDSNPHSQQVSGRSPPPYIPRLLGPPPAAETSTWQHTTLTRDRHPCHRQDSNPQPQQVSGRSPNP
jgi:hypothetical protein